MLISRTSQRANQVVSMKYHAFLPLRLLLIRTNPQIVIIHTKVIPFKLIIKVKRNHFEQTSLTFTAIKPGAEGGKMLQAHAQASGLYCNPEVPALSEKK